MLGVSGVRPSAVKQSASEDAGVQPGEGSTLEKSFYSPNSAEFQNVK